MGDSRSLLESAQAGSRVHKANLEEEMRELRKLRTAVMIEKCLVKSAVVMCPKPRRRYLRQGGAEMKVGTELSDIIASKQASPPCYSVSPPVRAGNPLIQDARFREQCVLQSPILGIRIEGLGTVDRTRRTQSIPTMA